MSQSLVCPRCGRSVSADAPQGQCPACMSQISSDASALADRPTIAPQSPLQGQSVTTDGVATLPPQTPVRAENGSAMTPLVEFESAPAATELGATSVHVPGYEILSELGRGGMGVVYKARHLKLNRVVALKMILAGGHAGAVELARFRTEAEAIARLQHPNIVQVHEIGEHEGKPYFSLEYCAGGSLAQKIDGTPLPPKEAAQLVETLARAMAAAHQKGIIHRDLKPANVLLSPLPLGEGPGVRAIGTPKITDFGLAKLDDAGQTQSGAVMGTPSYMAPEQAGGKSKEIGPAVDVYALGAILYELLTGRPPFKAATPLDTVLQVVSDDPVPPRQLQSRTPRDLETICLKCLRKVAAKRYGSADALGDDLRRFLVGEPIKARSVGRLERTAKWVARNRGLAAAILALFIGTALATWQAVREATQRKVAEKQLLRAECLIYVMQIQEAYSHLLNHDLVRCQALLDECRRDLRGPEYGYIAKQLQNKARTLEGHKGFVGSMVLSSDGKRMCSGSFDQTIKVWDLDSGKETLTLRGHSGFVSALALSVDGKRLCSGSGNLSDSDKTGEIKVWDLDTGKETLTLRAHSGVVSALALSVDGNRLYSGSSDQTIKVWDLNSGEHIFTLRGHTDPVNSLALSADGKRLCSGSGASVISGEIKVWDLDSGKETRTLRGHLGSVTSVILSDDSKRLYSASIDETIKVWDLDSGKETLTLHGHTERVHRLALSGDGKRLCSGSGDLSIKVWDLHSGKETLTLRGHTVGVTCLALSSDGKRLCSAGEHPIDPHKGREIKVWDLETDKESLTMRGHRNGVTSLTLSGDGKRLFSGSGDGTIKVWHLDSGKETRTLHEHTAGVSSLVLSGDGKRLCFGYYDKTIKVWDLDNGKESLTMRGHTSGVTSLALSRDGKRLYSGSEDQTIKAWNLDSGTETLTLHGHMGRVLSVALSGDGKRLYSGGEDRTIKAWDLDNGKEFLTLREHTEHVTSLALSMDGKQLCSGSGIFGSPGEIKVWDVTSGKTTLTLRGHTAVVSSLALSLDGKRLFSGSHDNTIKVWDLESGKETLTLRGHTRGVLSLALSVDGRRLFSGSYDETIKIWDLGVGLPDRELGR